MDDVALNQQVRMSVIAVQLNPITVVVFVNLEGGMVMHAREQSAAEEGIEPGGRIPTWDEDAFFGFTILVPLHGNPMGCVFGRNAQERWQESGSDVLQPNKADTSHACAVDQFGPEWCGEKSGQNIGVHPEVDQDSTVDDATDYRNLHGWLLVELTAMRCDG
jgi:hypothetical protein